MGGIDKGLHVYRGKPLIAHVIERLAPQVDRMLISANRNAETYASFGYPVCPDLVPGFAGPLAGIHAGLAACQTPLLATVPCDSPCLPSDLVIRLSAELLRTDAEIAIAATGERIHPVFALMKRDMYSDVAAFLSSGHRRLEEWCRSRKLCVVNFADDKLFVNINTIEDLAAAASRG
jgi:molybdopterin-guanine dinucleotide biosynthesis protein A